MAGSNPKRSHFLSSLAVRDSMNFCVLIVDDECLIRDVLRMALENEGYQCLEAENGLTGLEMLRIHTVDLVISDHHMPGMNGIDFIKELKKRYSEHAPPVILLSGANPFHLQRHAKDLAVSACLSKPYQLETLLHSVRQVITRSSI